MGTRTVNFTLTDEEHQEVTDVKNDLELTWPEFVLKAKEELGE